MNGDGWPNRRIVCADRASIEGGLLVAGGWALISIRDPRTLRVHIPVHRSLVDVLELEFHDAEPVSNLVLPDDIALMTADHAKAIWTFVNQVGPRVRTIVVQCEQGMSRSPAIAAALSRALGLDTNPWFEEYQPNHYVLSLMEQVIRGSGNSSMPSFTARSSPA